MSPLDFLFEALVNFFEPPALWELIFFALIPASAIAAAGIFAYVQLRNAQGIRDEERRAAAIAELGELLLDAADLVVAIATEAGKAEDKRIEITAMDKYRLNKYYVKACAHLEQADLEVAYWVQSKAHELFDIPQAMLTALIPLPRPGERFGPMRTAITNESTAAMQILMHWARREVPTSWFAGQNVLALPREPLPFR